MLVGARTRWGVVFCRPSDSLATVLRLLAENQLDWLPVVTGAGKFVGIISLDDIARSIALQEAASPLEPGAAAPSAGGGRA
jgi:CBS domain-containing protein